MGYKTSVPSAVPLAPAENAVETEIAIEGMSCAACVARVESSLRKLNSVETASVNLATERARVTYDPSALSDAEIIDAIERSGYKAHSGASLAASDRVSSAGRRDGARLLAAGALALPAAVISMIPALQFAGWEWVALALTAPVVLVAGWSFHHRAAANMRHGTVTMDTLVSLGTLSALGWSIVSLVAIDDGHVYFEVGALITVLVLLGRYLERGARHRSGAAVRGLLELGAREATMLSEGIERRVPVDALRPGDLFVVRPGERVATDGTIEEGSSSIDASMITGESAPINVHVGDDVVGGTVNTDGHLVVRGTRVGAETVLAQITRLVADSQAGKAPIQRLADRVAGVFVPVIVAISLATLVSWLAITGDAGEAFTAAIAVLIIACPCALGLATPTALMVGTGRGAQLGILIRGPEILERTQSITTIALDKTGTLTEGQLELAGVELLDGTSRADVLRKAGAVEQGSEHPVGYAIANAARAELGSLPSTTSFRAQPGIGVAGIVDHSEVEITRGPDGVVVSWDGVSRAVLTMRDRVKPTSAVAVSELEDLGLTPVLVSGDTNAAAQSVGRAVGIDEVIAGVLPHEKAEFVADLQRQGEVVAMVGDGVNDAPALAQADLGIALASGADIAMEASDITLLTSDLRAVADALRLSRRVLSTIKVNLVWAFAYNVAAIPLAVSGLLSPVVAAAAMAASSLLVVANSLRLKRFRSIRVSNAEQYVAPPASSQTSMKRSVS